MYAIVQIGGIQYKVTKGDQLDAVIKPSKKKEITVDEVLLVKDNKEVTIGKPYIKEAKVVFDVISTLKGKKVIAFKYKRRKRQKTKKGFRAQLTRLKVKEIKIS